MTPSSRDALPAKFHGNPPAVVRAIGQVEASSGLNLPEDYKEFLREADGGEGFVGNAYLILWTAEELLAGNQGYGVEERAPGLFLFGCDGGGEGLAFDARSQAKPIVIVPLVGMELKVARPLANTFNEFLEKCFNSGLFGLESV